jgi:hypothetical protein
MVGDGEKMDGPEVASQHETGDDQMATPATKTQQTQAPQLTVVPKTAQDGAQMTFSDVSDDEWEAAAPATTKRDVPNQWDMAIQAVMTGRRIALHVEVNPDVKEKATYAKALHGVRIGIARRANLHYAPAGKVFAFDFRPNEKESRLLVAASLVDKPVKLDDSTETK